MVRYSLWSSDIGSLWQTSLGRTTSRLQKENHSFWMKALSKSLSSSNKRQLATIALDQRTIFTWVQCSHHYWLQNLGKAINSIILEMSCEYSSITKLIRSSKPCCAKVTDYANWNGGSRKSTRFNSLN